MPTSPGEDDRVDSIRSGPPMLVHRRRILVIGSGGAGKSTIARRLGEIIGLPVIHLDRHYWQPGWKEPEESWWFEKVRELAAGERWIMDGSYSRTLHLRVPRSDAIVMLDLPRLVCIAGALGRLIRQRGQVREDMAPGCPESFDPAFLMWIWRYPRRSRPEVLRAIESARPDVETTTLRSRAEATRFLADVEHAARTLRGEPQSPDRMREPPVGGGSATP